MHAPVDDFKAQSLMRPLRNIVVDPGIGRHLDTTLRPRPILRRAHERSAQPLISEPLLDEPSFDKTHGPRGIASIGMRS